MFNEIIASTVCYTPTEYFELQDAIYQSHIKFGVICIVLGYLAGRFAPIIIYEIKRKVMIWQDS